MTLNIRNHDSVTISMNTKIPVLLIAVTAMSISMPGQAQSPDQDQAADWKLDPLSYAIGNFSTFAEIVNIGLKKMALSQALPAGEMDRLEREIGRAHV